MTASSTTRIYRGFKAAEDHGSTASSIDKVSVEVYEIQFFMTVFHSIRGYMFGLSFLTILNIYKNYFKGHKRLCTIAQEKISLE